MIAYPFSLHIAAKPIDLCLHEILGQQTRNYSNYFFDQTMRAATTSWTTGIKCSDLLTNLHGHSAIKMGCRNT
mgnify:CR=1 FL=1